ncbi:MAG: DJ-1/PfpI family protein [Provencibacterium sp.]|jgi:4-methyl-5(b-hydroxyethyl)-thiazole monophosphate biosynthesis|nr:DJ-1/PfpI family protein [Provencibacterium sp.]
MVILFLADGFEEAEALVPLDLLRRAGADVKTVSIADEKTVTGSHGIPVVCDLAGRELITEGLEMIVLPGGMPGTKNLMRSPLVARYLETAAGRGLYIAAICAAPSVLGKLGLLRGKRATCFPGFEEELSGAVFTGAPVEWDGRFITAKGMGVALEFGLTLVEALKGSDEAARIKAAIQCR